MSSKVNLSTTAANAAADAIAALANNGYIREYAGTQPADCATAISTQTLLAEKRFNATAFGAAVAGLITANAIAAVTIAASGVANFFRALKSDGTTVLFDGAISNQTVTLSAQANAAATSLAVTALSLPLYNGMDLWFLDVAAGNVLRKASVNDGGAAGAVAAAAGAISVPVSALAATIPSGSTAVGAMVVNSPNYQQNAQAATSSLTHQVSLVGS